MKTVAIVHDWLVSMRGGEKVLEALCEIFPDAALFTLVHDGALSPPIERMRRTTSFIDRLPLGKRHYQYYLPLFPAAVARFDLREYDLVISSSSCAAKGVRVRPDAIHVCYCHTPMRYLWDQYDDYFAPGRASLVTRAAMRVFRGYLRRWDVKTAGSVHQFVANSQNVRERIQRIYRRDATVIYPPVDVGRFTASASAEGDYFLIVSALVPYKRIDLAVEAFNRCGERLVIVGRGSEERRLKAMAGKNVEFVGWADDAALIGFYAGCRAIIFPGVEDFGIVPVEAMACGKPVVALGEGGVLETVTDGVTGVLYRDNSVEGLLAALRIVRNTHFVPEALRRHAQRFDRQVFKDRFQKLLSALPSTLS